MLEVVDPSFFRFRATKTSTNEDEPYLMRFQKKIKNPEMNTGNLRPIFFLIHSSAKAYHCICGRNIYLAKNSGFPIIFLQWFNCWLFIVSYVIGRTFVAMNISHIIWGHVKSKNHVDKCGGCSKKRNT